MRKCFSFVRDILVLNNNNNYFNISFAVLFYSLNLKISVEISTYNSLKNEIPGWFYDIFTRR